MKPYMYLSYKLVSGSVRHRKYHNSEQIDRVARQLNAVGITAITAFRQKRGRRRTGCWSRWLS